MTSTCQVVLIKQSYCRVLRCQRLTVTWRAWSRDLAGACFRRKKSLSWNDGLTRRKVAALRSLMRTLSSSVRQVDYYYGRPLRVSGRPCYILPMFLFIYFFLWPPYSPALVNGGSRKFYTWWTLSVIREVTTWIFSWSSLNYRVGQQVTKFGIFSDPDRKLSVLTPERGRIL